MSNEIFTFNLLNEDGFSRLGQIYTHRGNIDTPVFMPVGPQGTIKSAFNEDVVLALKVHNDARKEVGVELI